MVEAGISSKVSHICDNELGDEEEEDESFCLSEMLGGILFRGMEEWKEEEDNDNNEKMSSPHNANEQNKSKSKNKSKNKNTTKLHGRVDPLNCVSRRRKRSSTVSMNSDTIQIAKENDDDTIFRRAFYRNTNINKNHNNQSNMTKEEEKEEHPPLQICTIHNRGKGLIATNLIPKGSCIFTEQARVAAQVPPPSSTLKEEAKSNSSSNSNSNRNNNNDNNNNQYWSPIQACQYCFCSLESSNTISLHKPLPHQELWPILKLDFDNDNNHDSDPDPDSGSFTRIDNDDDHRNTSKKSSTRLLVDKFGRVKCAQCNLLFCSKRCYTNQINDYGSCCYLKRINDEHLHNQNLCLDEAPVTIAAKLFCHVTHSIRNHNQQQTTQHGSGATGGDGSADELLEKHFVFGLCGSSDNLTTLEIGIANNRRSYHDNDDDDDDDNDDDNNDEKRTDTNTVAVVYTLKPLYSFLTDLLNLSSHEQEFLSLDLLHSLACKAARNGFDIQTQSPFKPYYEALLRKAGGRRDSPQHIKVKQQIAQALGKLELERGMDREIDDRCCPEISSIFVLTARLNHSCDPNAYVIGQGFIDARIDVMASRTILPGEEIFISYIGGGQQQSGGRRRQQQSTMKRRRELYAKYMFTCECSLCCSDDGVGQVGG